MEFGFDDLIAFFIAKGKIYGHYRDAGHYHDSLSEIEPVKIVIIFKDIGDMEVAKTIDIFEKKLQEEKESGEINYDFSLLYEVIKYDSVWKSSSDHLSYVLRSVQGNSAVVMQSVIGALVKKTSPYESKYSIMEFVRLFKSTGKLLKDIKLPSI